jgi:hypothetical protein
MKSTPGGKIARWNSRHHLTITEPNAMTAMVPQDVPGG